MNSLNFAQRIRLLALLMMRRYLLMAGMSLIPFSFIRVPVIRICGITIGKGCYVGFHVAFDTNFPELIIIGDNVTISHNVAIYTHTITPVKSRLATVYDSKAAVIIHDGAWLSAGSMIVPGVEIGADCMIGAGSVVTRSTEPGSLYAGNPARLIKKIVFKDGLP